MKDYYKILNIKRSATQAEIKSAYRKYAKFWHPDKNKSPNAQKEFIKIQVAYEFLSNPEKKNVYDELLNREQVKRKANYKTSAKATRQNHKSYKEKEKNYASSQTSYTNEHYQREFRKYEDWLKEVRYKAKQKSNQPLDNILVEGFHFLDNYGIFIIIVFIILIIIFLLSI